jgi:formylglycine-generating enzyme required for sulfatase activity
MKYEISQGDYRDFLNTLTYRQQENRTAVVPSSIAGTGALSNTNRNGIDIQTPGVAATHTPALYACNLNANTTYNEAADGEWIACNHLNWMDGCAYIDWAGLRPMTELEYEKACRGDQTPVANEYAWGTATAASVAYTLSNAGQTTEAIATNYNTTGTAGNSMTIPTNTNITGPLRVGIFADISGTRVRTGATYYGIMEMSGNVWERAVTLGNATGRTFTGMHGDGGLSSNGHANQSNWPGLSSNEVTGSLGSGWRGGGWGDAVTAACISNRANASMEWGTRRNDLGFRGVRVAP